MRPIVVTTSDASGGTKLSSTAVLDYYGWPTIALQATVTGNATYTVQQTLDDVTSSSVTPTWADSTVAGLVAATTSQFTSYQYPVTGIRLKQTAGTGSVSLTVMQAGASPA